MQSLTVTLPDAIAAALQIYKQAQSSAPSTDAIVTTALEQFLIDQGYLPTESSEDTLDSAVESFRQGWHDAMTGNTVSIAQLWDGIDVE